MLKTWEQCTLDAQLTNGVPIPNMHVLIYYMLCTILK
jgi:hypothetical protein